MGNSANFYELALRYPIGMVSKHSGATQLLNSAEPLRSHMCKFVHKKLANAFLLLISLKFAKKVITLFVELPFK